MEDNLEDFGEDGKTLLECILKKKHGKMWTGCIWLSTETTVMNLRIL